MKQDLFNLDFYRWEIIFLSVIPALINFGILAYVTAKFQKTKTNIYFSIFVFLLGMWQLTDAFIRFSRSEETASAWLRTSEVFLIFIIPAGILFILRFTKWEKKTPPNLIFLLFLLPAVIFQILIQARFDSFTIISSKTIYWITNPNPTPFTITLLLWIMSGAVTMLVLLWTYFLKNKMNPFKRTQSLLLASGITLPVVGGILTEIFFPLILDLDTIPLAVPLMTAFSVTTFIAIKKYKILDFSPKHHWEQIILNEGLLIVDNNGVIMYANQTFCILTGYLSHEIDGKNANSIFLDVNIKFEHLIEDTTHRLPMQHEIELKTKTGEKKWVLVNSTPYIDSNGDITGSIAVLTDITILKNAEKELISNELRLKNAQKVANVGSWELEIETGKAIWSEEACRIYGLSSKERNQTFDSWLSFIHPEDLSDVLKEKKRARETLSHSSFKHRIICKDGAIKHIHSVSEFELNSDGNPVRLIGVCHDITKQVIAETAFIESEDRMTTFMNESLLCIYFVDPDTSKITYSNSAFQKLLGFTAQEIGSLLIYDFICHSKENIDTRLKEVITEGKISNGERQWKRKDGQIIHVLVSSFYVNRNGKKTVIVAAQDVTERKKAEEGLKLINQELETFIYRASHDLRGPLASIIGLANLSKLEIKDELALKYLGMIGTGTEKLDYTLTELVKAMEIRNIEEFNNKIDFEELVKEALVKFEYFPGYSRLKIDTDISIKKPFTSNKFILETIIQNLIENSIKYQNYSSQEPFLKIKITENTNGVNIMVSDNGLGIEKSIQNRIFEMYFRGSSDLKGSGLGLYLVKKGIEKLNGRIDLHSNQGEGATFSISLMEKRSFLLN